MKNRQDIYRYVPKKGKIAENFDARLRGKLIQRVEIRYALDGEISRVDIFCDSSTK